MSKNNFLAQYGDSGHIDKALNDEDFIVRCSAVSNSNATQR
jgi:uncharacterized protein YsxB (DUF464 family)